MPVKRTRTEQQIRRHFGLPDTAELMYYNKGVKKDAQGNSLRGWFVNEGTTLRYLGRGVIDAISLSTVKHAAVVPKA